MNSTAVVECPDCSAEFQVPSKAEAGASTSAPAAATPAAPKPAPAAAASSYTAQTQVQSHLLKNLLTRNLYVTYQTSSLQNSLMMKMFVLKKVPLVTTQ